MAVVSTNVNVEAVPGPIHALPDDRLQDLLKLQKAAQKITSILDLDQLIDKIVNDIACSFGCIEVNVYLHEPETCELVLAESLAARCTRKVTGSRSARRAWSDTSPPPARCATPPMFGAIPTTSLAKRTRSPRWPFRS